LWQAHRREEANFDEWLQLDGTDVEFCCAPLDSELHHSLVRPERLNLQAVMPGPDGVEEERATHICGRDVPSVEHEARTGDRLAPKLD
jgi:hypothetical protein